MSGFVKLFSSIVTSSVWCESDTILRIWIALLAMADADGVVHGTIPGFASLARVTTEQMREAVSKFTSPDPDSRTKDHEGRRIEVIDGGWKILNHGIYRERGQGKDGSRAPYFREYRKRVAQQPDVARNKSQHRKVARNKSQHVDVATQQPDVASNTEAEDRSRRQSTEETDNGLVAVPATARAETWVSQAGKDYEERFGGAAPFGVIGKFLKPLVQRNGWEAVREVWRHYLATKEPTFATPADFAGKYGHWLDAMHNGNGAGNAGMISTMEAHRRAMDAFVAEGEDDL